MVFAPVKVKVWGTMACFTRPEMKVERVSYEVMTPSAARGIFEAIYWKPEFRWEVREISVLKPIRFYSIVRNEVNDRAVVSTARQWSQKGGGYFADDTESKSRAQRHTLALRDVAYVIAADVAVWPGVEEDPAKFRDQFRRRVARGQCYFTPYLGCREFSASFEEPDDNEQPIATTAELGRMLFDLNYESDGSGRGQPRFFQARLEQGVLHVPAKLYR
jgi:CRISPR-associated protein Cas5d